ncbi:uncharacterized protein LOC128727098 [Anopheles nili]|uniref:uncharacterized protein LOC128727098 n=1 Tax=Anopheles nili TaxID=185578 RepID=UPI00237B18EB|nr:uncharacterized protein LOC128727098 [Anopheles nili]
MDCKGISRCSTLVVLFLVTLVNAQNTGARKRDLNNLYQVIYYGDSQVEVGKPFSISCIISIANPIEWHKDGEPIRKHSNIRHGKDEHSYIENEMGISGIRDKVEASISVQRALPKHQGKYQCNALYKNYHQLYVYRNGTLLGSHTSSAEKRHEEVPLVLGTARSTLMVPLSGEHHHFTTAVALAPGPSVIGDDFPGGDGPSERERESVPKSTGHSPHHHRQQAVPPVTTAAGPGHRHHAQGGGGVASAGEKKLSQQQQQHNAAGKEDSKRFVSQKTTIEQDLLPAEEVLEQTVQELESLPPAIRVDKPSSVGRSSVATKPKHSSAGRLQPPPPLIETREDEEDDEDAEDDEEDAGGSERTGEQGIGLVEGAETPAEGPKLDPAQSVEELVEPDTEIVIESKAISLEDDNIDRLIQNKSDINGIILVDSLEELPRKTVEDDEVLAANTALMTLPATIVPVIKIGNMSVVPTVQHQAATKTADSSSTGSTLSGAGEQDTTAHHHHHHHREHHTTAAIAAATSTTGAATPPITITTSTTTITTTSSTTTTTTTAATPTTTAADVLKPNYDHPSTNLKVFDIAKSVTLGCNVTQEGVYDLHWAKDGKNVSEHESLKDRFKILSAERKFIISRALETDAGQYTCSVPQLGVSKSFTVVANVVVKFESTEIGKTNIVEGETLTLHCIAFGTDPKITWKVGNNTYNASTDHIVLQEDERGVENAKLIIESIRLGDYGEYTCEARNNATDFTGKPAQVMIHVRIRGKYAALYVFLGIIVEVVLLCAIILICEKRRNKTEIEESDTDQSPDQNKNGYHGNESELRQRK